MDDMVRDFGHALHDATEPSLPSRERRHSDAGRSSALRPNLVAVSQMYRAAPATAEVVTAGMPTASPLQKHNCRAAVCAVLKAFETTELLEMILDNLCTPDVLRLRLVQRSWDDTISKSPTLRLHFFVHPQWDRHPVDFQLLGLKIPGLIIDPGPDVDMGRWVFVRMNEAASRSICPPGKRVRSRSIFEGLRGGLGQRGERSTDAWPSPHLHELRNASGLKYETLYVTQPPILGIQAFIADEDNEESEDEDLRACAKLHCDAGINLGFLAETTLSLLSDKKPAGQPDQRSVLFKAIVSFAAPTRAPGKRSTVHSVTRIG